MADDNPTTDDKKVFDRPEDAAGKKALEDERKARRDAEKRENDLKQRVQELENKDKPDVERLTNELAAANNRATAAETRAVRMEIAVAKKLTPAQANRLVGSTKEELEADADAFLAEIGGAKDDTQSPPPADDGGRPKPPPSNRPTTDLRAGGDPTQEAIELNPTKLAESIPRSPI